jgi:hypothetical protein
VELPGGGEATMAPTWLVNSLKARPCRETEVPPFNPVYANLSRSGPKKLQSAWTMVI